VRLVERWPNPFIVLPAADGIRAELRPQPIFRRPSIQIFQQERAQEFVKRAETAGHYTGSPVESASNLAFRALAPGTFLDIQGSPNVVLVLVESWGVANDQGLRSFFLEPYLEGAISTRYEFVQGYVPFHGSTVAGESRELCGQDLGFGILDGAPNCLSVPSTAAQIDGIPHDRHAW